MKKHPPAYWTAIGAILTSIGAIAAFLFSVFQYVDTKQQEAKITRFDQYLRVFDWAAGRTAAGKHLTDTHQITAIYLLSEFPEYKNLSLSFIDYHLKLSETTDPVDREKARRAFLKKSLLYSKEELPRR